MVSRFAVGLFYFFTNLWAFTVAAEPIRLKAELLSRFPATEAHQGVAVDASFFYAINNTAIGKYDKETGRRVGGWQGDPKDPFIHLNSCKSLKNKLRCAHSNSPRVPIASSIEFFQTEPVRPSRSISLGVVSGGLTFIGDHDNAYWLLLAGYDTRNPGRGTDYTQIIRMDKKWRRTGGWALPDSVLERMRPHSASGGTWEADGFLYLTGHDRKEMYVLEPPKAGPVLVHVATIAVPIEGQAFAFDHNSDNRIAYGIVRSEKQVIVFRVPEIPR